jgi:hypothetical protein
MLLLAPWGKHKRGVAVAVFVAGAAAVVVVGGDPRTAVNTGKATLQMELHFMQKNWLSRMSASWRLCSVGVLFLSVAQWSRQQ